MDLLHRPSARDSAAEMAERLIQPFSMGSSAFNTMPRPFHLRYVYQLELRYME